MSVGNPLVLVAHGSRDPRSADTMRALADACSAHWPAPVTTAFLDFNAPTVSGVLADLANGARPIVVPALLTRAYHSRVDVAQLLAAASVDTTVTPVLGPAYPGDIPDPLLVDALVRRLSELDLRYDGLVLLAAGTSYADARSTVDQVARWLESRLHVACAVGYASASGPTGAEAVELVRARGATRVAAASYFLAAGRLYDAAAASASAAGALGVAAPLGDVTELVELVLSRARIAVAR